ncbi:hypothetical protein [Pseudolysinimonas yzui]|uniref:Uncharacterized protein n=1 Tax=Pseudolysinimonas yzui TaxID=2708254 RepID=A0A8J3M2D0_9MICO|nr:hypothetical protein [Pseudolysinimonas yzui]GHF20845.1 hypothetical protein GCM10011600_22350 [Pseudolysinimonas yzui]
MRPLAKTLVTILLTLAIAYVLATVILAILNGRNLISTAIEDAWLALFTGGAVSIGLFLLFLLFANVAGRRRGSGSQFWINVGALIVAIVIGTLTTLAAGVLVGALTVGLAWLSGLGSLLAAGELFVGGVIALALTHFAIFKPRATEFEP